MAGQRWSFAELIEQVRQGSDTAATELIQRYGPHIVRVVRRRLGQRLRSQFDSVDFVQAVWASLFARRTELGRFDGPEALIAFLATIARNKVIDEARRRHIYESQSINRELPQVWCSNCTPMDRFPGPAARPSQIAMANELREVQEKANSKERLRQEVVCLRTTGASQDQIATQLSVHPKTVQRVLNDFIAEHFPWARKP